MKAFLTKALTSSKLHFEYMYTVGFPLEILRLLEVTDPTVKLKIGDEDTLPTEDLIYSVFLTAMSGVMLFSDCPHNHYLPLQNMLLETCLHNRLMLVKSEIHLH